MSVDSPSTFLSLFTGGGGLDLGLHLALGGSLRRGVYVEREGYALACLASRIEAGDLAPGPLYTDVVTFDARPLRGAVDVVAGGSPCQDLSVAGKRAGLDGARSGLFFHFVRIVDECQPGLVFWENVGGAIGSLPRVFDAFSAVGYRGAAVSIRASDVGAPHRRQRLFLLAYRDSCEGWHQPGRRRGTCRPGAPEPGDVGGDMADAGREGLPGSEWPGAPRAGAGAPRPVAQRGGHAWPPGPSDVDGWRTYLAAGGPAPAVARLRRGVDGLASGMVDSVWADRLRLLGNGVVPQQAAAAFTFLAAHLTGDVAP